MTAPIVVAGDLSVDWLAWPTRPAPDDTAPNWRRGPGTRMVARPGGALLFANLLRRATTRPVLAPALDDIAALRPDECLHSMVDLAPQCDGWRLERARGFCGPDGAPGCGPLAGRQPPLPQEPPAALVLDDAGNGFRDAAPGWEGLLATRPAWLVVKMALPLATGALWNVARHGPQDASGLANPERVVVVVNADDLRAEGITLSRRLSWERTAEDFVRHLGSNGRLASLVTAGHLLVRFGCEAVIHHQGRRAARPVLHLFPGTTEGDARAAHGDMVGETAAFTAALAAVLAEGADWNEAALTHGMAAARALVEAGFCRNAGDAAPDYPVAAAAARRCGIASVAVPADRIMQGGTWTILDEVLGDPVEAARVIVLNGPEAALGPVPVARFGKLATADRREAEGYRAIANLLAEHLDGRPIKPLSLAVFGPPGSGKSYGVKQVAQHVANQRKIATMTFNLSQMAGPAELRAALHLVRGAALGGATPLVFFDEFDAALDGELGWLRHFLAPMQDGEFLEGGHLHPIGPAVFVFAGGTAHRFEDFANPADPARRDVFRAAKGPDFASRLRGFVDIMGPDPRDENDRGFAVRRAFVLRRNIVERSPGVQQADGGLAVEEGVLHALLTVPEYRHGNRSIEAILAMSALNGASRVTRSALPPPEQLAMHVDAQAFLDRLAGGQLSGPLRERLGKLLHEAYRAQRLANARVGGAATTDADPALRAWPDLDEAFRESNRLLADDIPRKLRAIGCFMAAEPLDRERVTEFSPEEVARLAELEDERWNAERLQRQWRLGERSAERRTSPFLVPWSDLDAEGRSLDEAMARALPQVLYNVEWRIYRLGWRETTP
jgi:hypothetical protein